MHHAALLGAFAIASLPTLARAEEAPSPSSLPSPLPPPSPPAEAPPALDAEVAKQRTAIDELRAALDDERRAREHPFLRISGFLQIDWVIHNQLSQNEINGSTGQPLNQDRFALRRGHVRLDAEHGLLRAAVEIDANTVNGPLVRPIEANVSLGWPERHDPRLPDLLVTAGLLRIPFGFEVQETDWERPFLERASVLQALFPGEFDVGLRFKARYAFLNWSIAVMNGNPLGSRVLPLLDPVQTKDVVGRLGVGFDVAPGVRVEGGTSADAGTGFHPGTPATANQLVWQDQNGDGLVEPNEIVAVGGTPATPSQEFHRWALGGDARLVARLPLLGDLALRAEVVDGQNLDRGLEVADPIGASRNLREIGWAVGATQELTRWGMIGARYDRYNPDGDASQQRALSFVPVDRSYSTLALMGMVRYETARLLLEYDLNSNPLGVGGNGAPTTLADNALTLRVQMVF
jgi:hypothetical protein